MMPTWFLSTDPEYLRVRSLILRFLSSATGRLYVAGRLSADQEDDVQDAFLAYFEKVYDVQDAKYSPEVRLFFEVLDIRFLKDQASKMTIGDVSVERTRVPINTDGYCSERKEGGELDTADPDDDEPFGHFIVEEGADRRIEAGADLSLISDRIADRLSPREMAVIRARFVYGESFLEMATRMRASTRNLKRISASGMNKIATLVSLN